MPRGNDDRERFLEQAALVPTAEPALSTDEELLAALDATPINSWKERRQALPEKAGTARELAAKQLEPKSVTVKPNPATIKTETEVDEYLEELRAQLMTHVDAGETVII